MSAHRLGRDVFLALAAIGWADGNLDAEEADAIVRLAAEEGLEIDEIEEIEKATKSPVDLAVLDRSTLSKADRLFVYAVASWMTRLDGSIDDRELAALRRLGDLLKLPERPREHADMIALEIAELPEGDRPARYDLVALRKTVRERLAVAQRMRKLCCRSPFLVIPRSLHLG
jgi:tellurite resistance protein